MSHGPAGGGHGQQSAEPNLTPLLDLVLQLVMFFMLIANFAMDDLSDKVKLPVASQAKPLAAKDANLIFLNVDTGGNVLITGKEPLLSPEQIIFHMKQTARTFPDGRAEGLRGDEGHHPGRQGHPVPGHPQGHDGDQGVRLPAPATAGQAQPLNPRRPCRRRKEEPSVDVTLPITPMLDMSFQLLSFFVVTFRPPSQEGQLSVDLPKLDASANPDQSFTDAAKDEYTITVNGDTEIRSLTLKGPAVTEKGVADTGSLFQQLKNIAEAKGGGKNAADSVSITIESDDRLIYAKLIEVMDVCKKAGFESMNMKPFKNKAGG